MMYVKVALLQWFITWYKASGSSIKSKNISNGELAKKICKSIIRKFNKKKVHSIYIDNIWGEDLGVMQLISKFNKGFRFLSCVIDIFSKYAWFIPLKDKKGIKLLMFFRKFWRI